MGKIKEFEVCVLKTEETTVEKTEFQEVKANMNSFTYDIPHDFEAGQTEDTKIQSPFLFYTEEGEYLAGPVKDLEKIYITTEAIKKVDTKTKEEWETTKNNACKLNNGVDSDGISYKDFKHFAATVYGESAASIGVVIKEEIYAFASANHNYKKWVKERYDLDASYRKVISKTGAYAVGKPAYNEFITFTEKQRENKEGMKHALAAVINAINEGIDHSNGAEKWSGIDIVSPAEKWRQGYKFSSIAHDHFFLGNFEYPDDLWWRNDAGNKTSIRGKWNYKWKSTAAFSGINCDLKNTWWDDYKDNTKNPEAALKNYKKFQIGGDIDEVKKKIFFENETANKFGTVFCTLSEEFLAVNKKQYEPW